MSCNCNEPYGCNGHKKTCGCEDKKCCPEVKDPHCLIKAFAENVTYTGKDLFFTQIRNGDNLDVVIAKLNDGYEKLFRKYDCLEQKLDKLLKNAMQ